ncbi:unnamed protein product [Gadus morhua 'NCC']
MNPTQTAARVLTRRFPLSRARRPVQPGGRGRGGGYWWSSQSLQEVGSTWRDPRQHGVVPPGITGFSDDPPASTPAHLGPIRP